MIFINETSALLYLYPFWKHRVPAVVDHDVHESREGEEKVDSCVSDVADVLRVVLVLLRGRGHHRHHDTQAGQDELDDPLPGKVGERIVQEADPAVAVLPAPSTANVAIVGRQNQPGEKINYIRNCADFNEYISCLDDHSMTRSAAHLSPRIAKMIPGRTYPAK